MELFKIEVQEFSSKVVEVKAESESDAVSKVDEMYKNTEIVLDYDDFVEVNFVNINSESPEDKKDELIVGIIEYLYETEKKHYEEYDSPPEDHIYLKLIKLKQLLN